MKLKCLGCGHNVDLDDGVYGQYQGEIKCFACGTMLDVKIEDGNLKSVNIVQNKMKEPNHGEPTIRPKAY